MIKSISFDKSNRFFSYFLKSIQIVHNHGGSVQRKWTFDKELASFCKVDMKTADGGENRASYNPSNFPRYYGFLDLIHTTTDASGDYLLSTPRGERLLQLADLFEDPTFDPKNEKAFSIPSWNLVHAYSLFTDSLTFDSFGRQNTGAEDSKTDVDAPKIMMRLVYDLAGATKEEICYGIYALHRHAFDTIEDVEQTILANRKIPQFSYDPTFKLWKTTSQANDFKLAWLLADPGIALFVKNNERYLFNSTVPKVLVDRLIASDGKYHPLKLIVKIHGTKQGFQEWVRNVVAGSIHDDKYVWQADLIRDGFQKIRLIEFEKAVLTAYENPNRNVFFSMTAIDEAHIRNELGAYLSLLDRIDDFTKEYNGWSSQSVPDPAIYSLLLKKCSSYRGPDGSPLSAVLPPGEIRLPANFHFIGGIKNG